MSFKPTPIIVPVPNWQQSAAHLGRTMDFTNDATNVLEMVRTGIKICTGSPLGKRSDGGVTAELHNIRDMWRGYEWHLSMYLMMLTAEVARRPSTIKNRAIDPLKQVRRDSQAIYINAERTNEPWWFGEGFFHESHQAWLLREYPRDFKHHFPKAHHSLPMVWPPYEAWKRKVV